MPTEFSAGFFPQILQTINFVEDSPPRRARIDLNTASIAELQSLPGINLDSARKIVSARKTRQFKHVSDLVAANLVSKSTFAKIRKMVRANGNDVPYIYDIKSGTERVFSQESFQLVIPFDDSISGVRLIRLELDSVSHSLDITREITITERRESRLIFDLPAMEAGVMNVQISLYDDGGSKDYLARTLPIFYNPAVFFFPIVTFSPADRSLRLADGAALKKSDGKFHCNSNFTISNPTNSTVTINSIVDWFISGQAGNLESGSWDFGTNITLGPGSTVTGSFLFTFPLNSVVGQRLRAKELILTEWVFTQVENGALITSNLTWRALLGPNVNIILVGEEDFSPTNRFLIRSALRNSVGSIYQQQDLDIGTISTFIISVAQAGGQAIIDSTGEAEDLTSDWTVSNDFVDMFIVRTFVGPVAGLSPVDGPCDKDSKGMNGLVIEFQSSQSLLGVIMAHELGHYLGLNHTDKPNNIMNPVASTAHTVLLGNQASTMKSHCFIRFLG